MKLRLYLLISGSLFAFASLIQLLRVLTGTTIEVAGQPIPMFPSWIAVVVAAALAVYAFRLARR